MDFGRVTDVDAVDFTLPGDASGNGSLLARLRAQEPRPERRVLVGTSGWSDRRLVGNLYPRGTPSRDFLRHYSRSFPTNELNSTYYGYDAMRLAHWAATVPEGFVFCPKLPAEISHELQLDPKADAEMERFLAALSALGPHLGRAWTVLPPSFAPNRAAVLLRFLERFAARVPLAVELRHPGWFRDEARTAETFAAFESLGVTPILTDVAGRRDVLHMRLCTGDTLVRFVGNGLHPSDFRRLDDWTERIAAWSAAGLGTVYFYFHQRDDTQTVDLARHMLPRLAQRTGLALPVPPLPESSGVRNGFQQGELF